MKDLITITNAQNETRQVEVITTFNLEGYEFNYIIYRELDGSHTYVAKYMGNNIVDLDTNLTTKELELAETIYEGVKDNVRDK